MCGSSEIPYLNDEDATIKHPTYREEMGLPEHLESDDWPE